MKKRGMVLLGVMLILVGLMSITLALSSAVVSSSVKIQKQYKKLKALSYAEAGLNLGLWKVNKGTDSAWIAQAKNSAGVLQTDLAGGQYRIWMQDCNPVSTNCSYIKATGYLPTEAKPQATRTVRVKIVAAQSTSNISFKHGAVADDFGIYMDNNSKIKGSVYANGMIFANNSTVEITGSATSTGKNILESWISGGTIYGDAAAFLITGSTVKGKKTTGSYPPAEEMPIKNAELDSTINSWEEDATNGGTFEGTKTISGSTNQLGPIKINGDLVITNNSKLKVTGTIWVSGNITINNGASVYLDGSYGTNSGVIIADYKQNRTDFNKGRITIGQVVTISGVDPNNPKTPSYIMLFSTQSPKSPWVNFWRLWPAITINQNALGGVFYAPFGSILLENNAQARALASSGLYLKEKAVVNYDDGMANSSLASGPAGSWTITEWLILN